MSKPHRSGERTFRVVIDQQRLDEDLAHNSAAAQHAARLAAQRLRRDGATASILRPCQAEDRQGVNLPGCAKTYLPDVSGAWGMVFSLRADDQHQAYLELLVFGQRHPKRESTPSVYQVAAIRLRHL